MNYRQQLKAQINLIVQTNAYRQIAANDGPSNAYEGQLDGKVAGMEKALLLYDEATQDNKLVPEREFEGLSATLLANARGALERSRHEAYPKTASEVEGYARGLQQAAEQIQELLDRLRGAL